MSAKRRRYSADELDRMARWLRSYEGEGEGDEAMVEAFGAYADDLEATVRGMEHHEALSALAARIAAETGASGARAWDAAGLLLSLERQSE